MVQDNEKNIWVYNGFIGFFVGDDGQCLAGVAGDGHYD
jgi:hypothetical protein